jgi:hypothetical protein
VTGRARTSPRRVVVTVCLRERGVVALPIERGGRVERLDAGRVVRRLQEVVAKRGLADRVRVETGCAGGCTCPGPNVSLAFYAEPRAGEPADHVAIGWRTYAASLAALDCLARVVDDNVGDAGRAARRRRRASLGAHDR